jgi:hypothetical protein
VHHRQNPTHTLPSPTPEVITVEKATITIREVEVIREVPGPEVRVTDTIEVIREVPVYIECWAEGIVATILTTATQEEIAAEAGLLRCPDTRTVVD